MCESTDRGNGHFNFLDLEFLFLFCLSRSFCSCPFRFYLSTCFFFVLANTQGLYLFLYVQKRWGIITFEFEFILYRRGGRSVDRATEILYEMEWNILSPLLNKKIYQTNGNEKKKFCISHKNG